MKELTITDGEGIFVIKGHTTFKEITERLNETEARKAIEAYVAKPHIYCDCCGKEAELRQIRNQHLCVDCRLPKRMQHVRIDHLHKMQG